MELIDKAAMVAEIEKRLKKHVEQSEKGNVISSIKAEEDLDFISFLNTLEVKEVDLEKEIDSYFERFQNVQCDEDCCNEGGFCCVLDNDLKIVDIERCRKIARHFFELGLKAQKGE